MNIFEFLQKIILHPLNKRICINFFVGILKKFEIILFLVDILLFEAYFPLKYFLNCIQQNLSSLNFFLIYCFLFIDCVFFHLD